MAYFHIVAITVISPTKMRFVIEISKPNLVGVIMGQISNFLSKRMACVGMVFFLCNF